MGFGASFDIATVRWHLHLTLGMTVVAAIAACKSLLGDPPDRGLTIVTGRWDSERRCLEVVGLILHSLFYVIH